MEENKKDKKALLEQLSHIGILGYLTIALIIKGIITITEIIFGKRK